MRWIHSNVFKRELLIGGRPDRAADVRPSRVHHPVMCEDAIADVADHLHLHLPGATDQHTAASLKIHTKQHPG